MVNFEIEAGDSGDLMIHDPEQLEEAFLGVLAADPHVAGVFHACRAAGVQDELLMLKWMVIELARNKSKHLGHLMQIAEIYSEPT